MSEDRVFHREPALTLEEMVQRANPRTRIQIKHSYDQPTLIRDWVRDSADQEAKYGYAERRGATTIEASALDMSIPGAIDVAELTSAILAELKRQSESR